MDSSDGIGKYSIEMEGHDAICSENRNLISALDPGIVGQVCDKSGNVVGNTTPLIVALNYCPENWVKNIWNRLVRAGHDPHKKINYFGKNLSALEILGNCKGRTRDFLEGGGLSSVPN